MKSTVKADANHNAGTISHIWNRPFALQTGYFPPNMRIRQNNRLWAGSLFSKSCRAEWRVVPRPCRLCDGTVHRQRLGGSLTQSRRMAGVITSEPWPQPRFSLLSSYFYIWVCHFNLVDKNQNSRLYSKRNASVIRHKKNIDIRRSKGYTDVATQIYIIPESIGVYFYLGKNACFWLSYL